MKTEIGGTFKWSEEQVKAYAAAFREGDAVKVKGEWHEVKRYENTHSTPTTSTVTAEVNPYNLNYRPDGEECYKGIAKGFLESRVESPYEITTPKDYEVREGDKLVWLGESNDSRTFGKSYITSESVSGMAMCYRGDDEFDRIVYAEDAMSWGVIPEWENVKEEEEMNEKDECVGKFKKGDRVRVTGGSYKGSEGSVGQSDELGGGFSYVVLFDDGRDRWFEGEFLELVEEEKSPEQEAFEYLLTLDETAIKNFMTGEINDWAKELLEQKDYDSAKQAIEILEKLEKGE